MNAEEPNPYAADRLAARAANYRTQVARLRALITPDAETDTESETQT